MATKKMAAEKARRPRFSAEFKQQALLRAVKDGVPVAARELGLEPAQLYAWRSKAQQQGQNDEAQRLQQSELARLRRDANRHHRSRRQAHGAGRPVAAASNGA